MSSHNKETSLDPCSPSLWSSNNTTKMWLNQKHNNQNKFLFDSLPRVKIYIIAKIWSNQKLHDISQFKRSKEFTIWFNNDAVSSGSGISELSLNATLRMYNFFLATVTAEKIRFTPRELSNLYSTWYSGTPPCACFSVTFSSCTSLVLGYSINRKYVSHKKK